MLMYKAAVLADENLAPAFKALGFDAWSVSSDKSARQAWRDVSQGQYAVILVAESVHDRLQQLIAETYDAEQVLPIVTVIPGPEGSTGQGLRDLKQRVEKAIGVDILFKGEEA